MAAHERAAILYRVAEAISKRIEEAARIISEESGKPIRASRAEANRTVQTYQFSAEAARSIRGETIQMDAAPYGEHHTGYTIKHPLGVVAAITPFNFPMNLVAHKVGPGIAAGNTRSSPSQAVRA